MTERGYQWFVLVAGFHSWASLIGFDAFTGDWLTITCVCSAAFWYGYFCGWCTDPSEVPAKLFGDFFGMRKLTREADALQVSIEYMILQGKTAR